MEKKGNVLMKKYEIGRLLGQGTFAKVHYARDLKSGQSVAIKIIDKEKILKVGLIDQTIREISVMRRVRHPNVVRLYEVMASKTKIYFAMEYIKGGELFDLVAKGRLKEETARKYFQQLIAAVDFCHSRGVYHRDLKPENLLLDEDGNLKVSDFGLSALSESRRQDGLLHTTCGTPAYVAPEVIHKKGYEGVKADIWSCGVILYVLLAGYLPFHDQNLMEMYKRISRGYFRCPQWFPLEVRKLLCRILHPNPMTRITVAKIMENCWFKKGFPEVDSPIQEEDCGRTSISDITSVVSTSESESEFSPVKHEDKRSSLLKPNKFNAFHIISCSKGFDLSGLFADHGQKYEARFSTTKPPSMIVSRLEEIATTQSFEVAMQEGSVILTGRNWGRKGKLAIDAEIYELTPSLHFVELKKKAGDTFEFRKFCNYGLRPSIQDLVWTWDGALQQDQAQPA